MEVEYWQSRVKVTQIPLEIEEVIYTDNNTGRQFKAPKSILLDPFVALIRKRSGLKRDLIELTSEP